MASHLTTLIKRVRAIPYKMKQEPIFFSKLINIAEYLYYEEDYTEFEERKAKAILKVHELDYLLDIESEEEFERTIRHFISEKKGTRVCIRCGRSLSKPESVRRGYGEECYSKRKIVDGGEKLTKFFDLLGDDESES